MKPQPLSKMNNMRQICLSESQDGGRLVFPSEADARVRTEEKSVVERSLEASCSRNLWPKDSHLSFSPHPMVVNEWHNTRVQAIHEALVLAITNIVERWWTDHEARFPERMPLEPQEESLLRVSLLSLVVR